MINVIPTCLNRLKHPLFYIKPKKNQVFLTIDDGPSEDTHTLFSFITDNHISASHFWFFEKDKDLFKSGPDNNNLISFHGYQHTRYGQLNQNEIRFQLENMKTEAAKLNINTQKWFRPPYGSFNRNLLKSAENMSLNPILWSYLVNDYVDEYQKIKIPSKLVSGDIIVLHDNPKNYPRIFDLLLSIIELCKQLNLQLTALPNDLAR